MYTATHRATHCSTGLQTTAHNPREISASAKNLMLFHDHNNGKTLYTLQFQFICIPYSCKLQIFCITMSDALNNPCRFAWVCKMRHSITLLLLHRTSTPWMTTWIGKCATRHKKYTETSRLSQTSSMSQSPCAKCISLQPWHESYSSYSSRAA